jgi:predicted metalloprotease with PDZ domain
MQTAIRYTIAMPQPHTHRYHVTVSVEGLDGPTLDLALPVWTPGSYLVREFARHVQEFAAADQDGRTLPWRKVDKCTWRIETGGARRVQAVYQVYAFDLTVRTSHLDGTHGFFNPSTLCMYVPSRLREPLEVRVDAPPGWRVTTGLEPLPDRPTTNDQRPTTDDQTSAPGAPRSTQPDQLLPTSGSGERVGADPSFVVRPSSFVFVAADYDELVDSPFECGTHRLLTFEVDGVPHEIALWGRGNEDTGRLLADTRRIVETARDMFGGLPYRRYVFIIHLAESRNGLEHRNSTVLLVDRWSFQPRASYEGLLGLISHEFFHTWNVKRIRPAPLGPFDYQRENYTRQLWAIEGVTSYYDDLLLVRAGLLEPERYLELLAEHIVYTQSTPGRAVHSLEQSGFDAWIKFYRPDENTPNSTVSYYTKGAVVALLLDLEIRQATGGARSLDDVMRHLFAAYSPDAPGYPEPDGFLRAVEQATGRPGAYDDFFARYVGGTAELDYARAFGAVGLLLDWRPRNAADTAWLGLRTKSDHGRTVVSVVYRDGPAETAGVYANDELLALDGFRIDEARLEARLGERRPGDRVTLSLFRRDELLHIPVTLAPAPPRRLALIPDSRASDEQIALYLGWLSVPPEEP